MSNYNILKNAVLGRYCLTATYKRHQRKLSPHVIGTNDKHEEHLLAYQYGGSSSSGLPNGGEWRCFKVEDLTNIERSNDPWQSTLTSRAGNSCITRIDAEVNQ